MKKDSIKKKNGGRRGLALFCSLVLALSLAAGCGNGSGKGGTSEEGAAETETNAGNPEDSGDNTAADSGSSSDAAAETVSSQTDADMFTDRDYRTEYAEEDSVLIQLNGTSATASSDSVVISGSTITITEEATYILSGTLEDGMVIVDAPDTAKLQLVLNEASIHSETSAPLYIREADKVFVTLAEGSENTLSNGGTFTAIDENNIDAVIFSKQDLTLNGSGSLTVTSPGGHGIVSKDDLVLTGGTCTVSAASQGLDANDSIRVTGDTALTVTAGKDGFHAENDEDTSLGFVYISGGTLHIEAEGDGISAGAWMQIAEGSFQILAGGGSENGSQASSDAWGAFPGGGGISGEGGMPGAHQAVAYPEAAVGPPKAAQTGKRRRKTIPIPAPARIPCPTRRLSGLRRKTPERPVTAAPA